MTLPYIELEITDDASVYAHIETRYETVVRTLLPPAGITSALYPPLLRLLRFMAMLKVIHVLIAG